MKILLSTALILAISSAVSASVITLPVRSQRNPENLNAESLTKRYLQKRAASSTKVPLTNIQNDVIYTVPLGLGTPAQEFNLIIDTGSPITWVSAKSCVIGGCLRTNKFDCASSSTCRASTTPFNVSYVSGQGVRGNYVADIYKIGSLQFQGIAGVVTTNQARLPGSVDGIMGLWYYASGSDIPILNVLKNTTALTENMIGVWLQKSSGSSRATSPGGEITFGGVNPARYTGEITYVDCVAMRPWSIPVNGMTVNGKDIPTNGAIAAIDTGTTAMLMPKTTADAINSAIPGAISLPQEGGLWVLPCSGDAPITITFGNFKAEIPYTSLAMQSTRQRTSQGYYCTSAAMFPTGETATIDEWLIGDAFLTNVYSVFDFNTNAATGGRIGFAKLSGSSSNGDGNNGGGGGSGGNNAGNAAAGRSIKGVQTSSIILILASIFFSML